MSLRNNKSRNIETNTYDCCHCGKKYKSCAGKCYHEKRCSKNEALFQNTRSETALQFKHLQDQILELHNIITTASGNDVVPSTTTNNITNNTQNITQINIVDFGQENLSSLTHEFLKDCLLRCQPTETLPDDNENGMTKLWKKINSIPENRNVRVRNISHGFMEKRENNRWVPECKDVLLDQMITKSYMIMDTFKGSNRDDLEEDNDFQGVIEDIEEYLYEVGRKDPKLWAEIKRSLYNLLMKDRDTIRGI